MPRLWAVVAHSGLTFLFCCHGRILDSGLPMNRAFRTALLGLSGFRVGKRRFPDVDQWFSLFLGRATLQRRHAVGLKVFILAFHSIRWPRMILWLGCILCAVTSRLLQSVIVFLLLSASVGQSTHCLSVGNNNNEYQLGLSVQSQTRHTTIYR